MATAANRAQPLYSLVLLTLLLLGTGQREHPARLPWLNTNLKASIRFVSQTQASAYGPVKSQVFDRFVRADRKLSALEIAAHVTIHNVEREPCNFVFKWFDPAGKLIEETERERPDPDPLAGYPGHWWMYPIVQSLDFKDRPTGKYTFVVEYPAGTVIAEKSFNIYELPDNKQEFVARNTKAVWIVLIGVVLLGLFVASAKVLS
ncbi:MAG: hypothetical protein P8181_04085 [bacterium]